MTNLDISSNNPSNSPSAFNVCFITMGCAKNEVDTLNMKRKVSATGYKLVDNPDSAHVVIINTCSFIEAATKESLDVIFDITRLPQYLKGSIKLIVAGCMPARFSENLEDSLTEASAFVPCDKEDDIVNVISNVLGIQVNSTISDKSNAISNPSADTTDASIDGTLNAGPFSAYIKISDGCNRFCSFCSIPYIRGRYHSFSYEDICENIDDAINAGAREIILIAQNTGKWGSDFSHPLTTSWLIDNLAQEYTNTFFRVMYLQPEEISDELLFVMKSHDNIINYLDIPLQHICEHILRDMNRLGSKEEFVKLVDHIKEEIPDITLRTTLIAGFPGESDQDFEELCDFCEEGYFDYIGVFSYSREESTPAYDLPNQIDEDEKKSRAQRLRDISDAISTSKIGAREGKCVDVLIEGINEEGNLFGRATSQAPEVDGITYVDSGTPGDIVKACIVDSIFYDMEVEVVDEK